jgi:hypothetical protein
MPSAIPDLDRYADEVRKRANVLREIDMDAIARVDLGPLHFKDLVPILRRSCDTLLRGASVDLFAVPPEFLRELNERLNAALRRIDEIRKFNPSTQGPREREVILRNWIDEYRGDYDAAAKCLAAAPITVPDFSAQEKLVADRLTALADIEKRFEDIQLNAKTEITAVLKAAREAAAGTGIAEHAKHFETEAREHRNAARWWLLASAFMAAATLVIGLCLANSYAHLLHAGNAAASPVKSIATTGQPGAAMQEIGAGLSIQLALARLIIFSILYVATLWCGRNYKAHKHNQITNRHRQLALRTFEAFNNSTADVGTKNAVLLQTTAAIFGAPSTGFSADDGDSGAQPKIIELVKSVTSGKAE